MSLLPRMIKLIRRCMLGIVLAGLMAPAPAAAQVKFDPDRYISIYPYAPGGVATVDLNEDGFLDFVSPFSPIQLSDGAGGYVPTGTYASGLFADLNGDGHIDQLVLANDVGAVHSSASLVTVRRRAFSRVT